MDLTSSNKENEEENPLQTPDSNVESVTDPPVRFRTPPLRTSSPRTNKVLSAGDYEAEKIEKQLQRQSAAEPKAFVSYHDVVDELAAKLGVAKSPRRALMSQSTDEDEEGEELGKPVPSPITCAKATDDNLHAKPGVETLVQKQGMPIHGTIPLIEDMESGRKSFGEVIDIPLSPEEDTLPSHEEPVLPDAVDVIDAQEFTKLREPENVSESSYYMKKTFQYYFQHPWFRLLVAYLVIFLNFLIFAEDPVSHSYRECAIPVVGHGFSFLFMQYPPNAWSCLKVVLWLSGIICGMVVGKLVIHKQVLNRLLRLSMFQGDNGSWMIMFLFTVISIFVFTHVYNAFLLAGAPDTDSYRITSAMGIPYEYFMKMAACGTWLGDFVTAWMVTDLMLQDRLYPHWAIAVRAFWKRGRNRIVIFWTVWTLMTAAVLLVIIPNWISWDSMNRGLLPTSELSRAFLASFILVLDLLILMQDWDFPHFESINLDIKLPGLNVTSIEFKIPAILRKKFWIVHVSGKWLNYGIIVLVMCLDLNMWLNQVLYYPYKFGQYTDPHHRIHTVSDQISLESASEWELSYAWRSSQINNETDRLYIDDDGQMNSKYLGYSLAVKSVALIPSILAFLGFFILIGVYGRIHPDSDNRFRRNSRMKMYRKDISRGDAVPLNDVCDTPETKRLTPIAEEDHGSYDGDTVNKRKLQEELLEELTDQAKAKESDREGKESDDTTVQS